jgi:hypothetical protein
VVEVEGGFRLGSDNTYGFHVEAYNNHYPLIIDPVLLDYSTYLGGEGSDGGTGIAVDSVGNAYVTGYTSSSSPGFPTTPGAYQTANAGLSDAFVTKLAPAGNALVYSTYLGGEMGDEGYGIAVDSGGNAYVTGETYSSSPGFPTTLDAYQTAKAGETDAFVTELSSAGIALVYSTYLGGEGSDVGCGIAVDSGGHVYVTGGTSSDTPGFPTTLGAYQTANAGSSDAFVTKIGGFTVPAPPPQEGCFIATAAYGTPMAEEIQILREFRDEYLLTSPVGQALVDIYYRVSPPIAEFITEHPSLKPIVRAGLLPAVAMSTAAVNTTPAEKAAIAGLVVLVSVALAAWARRRRGRGMNYTLE